MICSYVFKARQSIKATACVRFDLFKKGHYLQFLEGTHKTFRCSNVGVYLKGNKKQLNWLFLEYILLPITPLRLNIMELCILRTWVRFFCHLAYRLLCACGHIIPHVKPAVTHYENRTSCMHNFTLLAGSIYYLCMIFS